MKFPQPMPQNCYRDPLEVLERKEAEQQRISKRREAEDARRKAARAALEDLFVKK